MNARSPAPFRGRRAIRTALACALAAAFLGSGDPGPSLGGDRAPSEPRSLSGSAVSDTEIDLSWQAPSQALLLQHYRVYRDSTFIGTTTNPSFSDTGLQPSTAYDYEVSAVDLLGEGPRSSLVTVTTMAPTADTTPPTTPAGLQADASGPMQVDLSWQAATDPETGVAHYRVYRDGSFVATATGTSFSDSSVQPQTTYSYEVSAVNGDGLEGARSASASATTPAPPPAADTTPPNAPPGLEAEPVTARQIDLSWGAAVDAESGVDVYNVFRDGSLLTSTAGTAFSDGGVSPATTYVYQVSAVNGEGLEGPKSTAAQATTPDAVDTTPPAPPSRPRIIG